METQIQPPPVQYWDNKPPTRPTQRINVRMIVFLAFISLPFLFVAGVFVKGALNGGIEKGKDFAKVDLKSMGNFTFDSNNGTEAAIPTRFRQLDGQKVQIQGFIAPPNSAGSHVGQFQFVYNVQRCCFNGPPQVQERVYVNLPANRRIRYSEDFMQLTGTLHVKVERDDVGVVQSVYTMDVDRAEAVY